MESYERESSKKWSAYIYNSRVFKEMADNWYAKTIMRFKNEKEFISYVSLIWMNIN